MSTATDHGVPEGVKIVEVAEDPYTPGSPLRKRAILIEPDVKKSPYDVDVETGQ